MNMGAFFRSGRILRVGKGWRPASTTWAAESPFQIASPELVGHDLGRLFEGSSWQVTPILAAVTHGAVRFCTHQEESLVLAVLADLVVEQHSAPFGSQLHPSAAKFLTGLASPRLANMLRALEPVDEEQAVRRTATLDIVNKVILDAASSENRPESIGID